MTPCPTREQFQRMLKEEIDEAERLAIEGHVQTCPSCQETLAQLSDDTELRSWYRRLHDERPDANREGEDGRPPEPRHTAELPLQGRRFGHYELLEEIGRGGMGVVYKARQLSLKRTVAVKMILSGQLASQTDGKRFRSEAEAAALLQHPNILTVHEVGEYDSRLFFSMDYVEGKSLAALIRENPLPAAQAARYVQRIAEAIHYAHQQGILHRDLKPSNILVDGSDSPRVMDFGLAKRIEGDSQITPAGAVLGTPSYISPEQAAGERSRVGPASDVYSLGAILYELVTGRPPFRAETPLDTLLQVLQTEPVGPRLLNPKVPRDLETITLKCLAKEPGGRYATAQELAEDLRRWLVGEPIRARPVGGLERAWRWCRREPRVASLAAALLWVTIALFASVTALWRRAEYDRRQAQHESRQADEHRIRIDETLRKERDAVDQSFLLVSESSAFLRDTPGMHETRKRLLERYRTHYEQLTRQYGERHDLQAALADAHNRLGLIAASLGETEKASDECRQAIAIYERLVKTSDQAKQYEPVLATCYNNLGIRCWETGKLDESLQALHKALAIHERLTRENPSIDRHQDNVAITYMNIGNTYKRMGTPVRAREAYQMAQRVGEELLRKQPNVIRYRESLAKICLNIGVFERKAKNFSEALAAYQQAIALGKELVEENPGVAEYQSSLALAYNNLGNLHRDMDALAEAVQARQEAIEIYKRLTNENPAVPGYLGELASSYHNSGVDHFETGDREAARAAFEQSIEICERLVRDYAALTEPAVQLAKSYFSRAKLLKGTDAAVALDDYDRGIRTLDKVLQQSPAHAEARLLLAETHFERTALLFLPSWQRQEEALQSCQRVLDVLTPIFEGATTHPDAKSWLARAYVLRATTLDLLERYDEALSDWQQALELHAAPDRAKVLCSLEVGSELIRMRQLRQLGLGHAFDPRLLRTLDARSELLGRHGDAAATANEATEVAPVDPANLYAVASACALVSQEAREDDTLSADDRTKWAEQYAIQAVALLKRAAGAGYFHTPENVRRLHEDRSLNSLHGRPDFLQFRTEIMRD